MSWSPQQQAMLTAMGYTLYRQVDALPILADSPAGAPADRLLQALQRAAGGRDLAGFALPPLPELRANAAAKRALWPRLRALRRS
jgi:hypothetical protein